MFIQTLIVYLHWKGASEFQGESAADFSFNENQIGSVMHMIAVVINCV